MQTGGMMIVNVEKKKKDKEPLSHYGEQPFHFKIISTGIGVGF